MHAITQGVYCITITNGNINSATTNLIGISNLEQIIGLKTFVYNGEQYLYVLNNSIGNITGEVNLYIFKLDKTTMNATIDKITIEF